MEMMMMMLKSARMSLFMVGALLLVVALLGHEVAAVPDYADALTKSLKYFEAQRSGKLPSTQRVTWRGDSGLSDGLAQGIDLSGGYYDAGDNVKYGFPMAFTITMLSWSVIQYREQLLTAGQLDYALEAIKWGTDYFIKCHPSPNVLWGEVGDGTSDHKCWMRPEDMVTPRTAYKIDANNPGSDLAGETSAAMAAASIVFRNSNPTYSATLLGHSRQLFTFADTYRGAYDNSISVAKGYYNSWSGYDDELLWAAVWLFDATGENSYLQYVVNNAVSLGGVGWALDQFSWDNKYVGVQLKVTKILLDGKGGAYTSTLEQYRVKAEYFLCAALQKNNGANIKRSPGGMFWIQNWNNMQYVTTASFILTVASDYYTSAGTALKYCASPASNSEMLSAAQTQVNYILGQNSRGTSYFIGYGSSFPERAHHRGASISAPVGCSEGFNKYYFVSTPNPHILEGAVTGGPDASDNYQDVRDNYAMSEPVVYNTAPLVGVLARFSVGASLVRSFIPTLNNFSTNVNQLGLFSSHTTTIASETHQSTQTRRRTAPVQVTPPASPFEIKEKLVDKWVLNNRRYFKFTGKITNISNKTIKTARFVVHRLYSQLWGLDKVRGNGNIYTLPAVVKLLKPGESVEFAYVKQFGKAQIYVRSYTYV